MLRRAERDAETISAVVRLAVFLSLAITIFAAVGVRGAVMGTAPYGLVTGVGLFLAWRRIFHPAIPFLLVTFDIILVVAQVRMLTYAIGMPADSIFRLPATALVFDPARIEAGVIAMADEVWGWCEKANSPDR